MSETGRPAGQPLEAGVDFQIYRSGRVEKILTGSISGTAHSTYNIYYMLTHYSI